jgi:hypothetical protein
MKIPEDIRRSVSEAADKVVEMSQQLGKEAQLQVQLKKLQVEQARKIHDLGKRTFQWYRLGTMIVSGPIPPDVVDICATLDATEQQIQATQLEIENVRISPSRIVEDSKADTSPAPENNVDAGSYS